MSGQARRFGAGLRLEQLEARDVPAITTAGLPTWLAGGPSPQINNSNVDVDEGALNQPSSGAVDEVAPHPTDPNILFAGTTNGGVWRTRNAQATSPDYQPLTDNLPSLSIAAMDLNPDNPNQLVAGVGLLSAANLVGGDRIGLLITDNALDANPLFRVAGGPLAGQDVLGVVARTGYILAAASNGLYRSTDGGATFSALGGTGGLPATTPVADPTVFDADYYFVTADPADSNRVYALGKQGLFRSDDIRAAVPTWTNVTSPLMLLGPTTRNGKIAIHDSAAGSVVWVAASNDSPRGGWDVASVTYSTDRGATWEAMDLPEYPDRTNDFGQVRAVLDATNASPIQIESPFHGLVTGDKVQVSGVVGNNGANAIFFVTETGQDTFTLDGSVGTGDYVGGGVVEKVVGPNAGFQGYIHLSLAADPTDPDLIYIGGDRIADPPFTGNFLRGDRSIPAGGGNFVPSPQWTAIVDSGATDTAPYPDTRALAFDATGNLVAGTDGGLYKRLNPRTDAAWVSINGDIDIAQFYTLSYDARNDVLFGGTQDTGTAAQLTAGSMTWNQLRGGDGGFTAADNTSVTGRTLRYTTGNSLTATTRFEVDGDNKVVAVQPVLFSAPDDAGYLAALDDADKGLTVFSAKLVLNTVDPRRLMLGNAKLYEDDNPAGRAGDVVVQTTPAGLTGLVSAITYGGRQAGVDIPRVAYIGSSDGQLFLRGAVGGFAQLTKLPGTGPVESVVIDPDDFRRVYVLRGDDQIYFSGNSGQAWTAVTQNLVATALDAAGNPVQYAVDPATGAVTGGLTTSVTSLAIYDSAPGTAVGGGEVVFASGRGGVYRYVPGLTGATPSPNFGWTEYGAGLPNGYAETVAVYGNRLIVGTQGRGAWSIPDISASATVAATVTVSGDAAANNLSITAVPGNPNLVVVSDGLGNTLTVDRSASPTIRFEGGAGADTITISSGVPGQGLAFLNSAVVVDAGGDVGDRLVIRDTARTTPTTVTVTATAVGGGAADDLFGGVPGAGVRYTGLGNGELQLDLGDQAVAGSRVNVRSTSAGLTRITGTNGADTFVVNGLAGAGDRGDLAGVSGVVELNGRNAGTDVLVVSDFAATGGNQAVTVAGATITGFAGPTDAAVVRFSNVARLELDGSDSPTVADVFTVADPAADVVIRGNAGPDRVVLQSNTKLVTVDAGAGDNQLVVDDTAAPAGGRYTVGGTTLTAVRPAGTATVTFTATGGRFATADGAGVLVRGSNAGNDTFTVTAAPAGGQVAVAGNGGDDTFTVTGATAGTQVSADGGAGSDTFTATASPAGGLLALAGGAGNDTFTLTATDTFLGRVEARGGAGADTFTLDASKFGSTADTVLLSGGGGGDRATVTGVAGDDPTPVTATLTSATAGALTGVGKPVNFDTLADLVYDGGPGVTGSPAAFIGRNGFTLVDATNQSYGSVADFLAGVVFRSASPAGGTFTINRGAVGPAVTVRNVNGSDAGGLVYTGDPTGTGRFADTLTVLGVSDTGLGTAFGEPTATDGADDVVVSDAFVAVRNATLGDLRTVALGRAANGAPTVSTLYVRTGTEAGRGDTVRVRPSRDTNIVVDSGGPARQLNGDRLVVDTAEPTTSTRSADPALGPVPTRLTTPSGASFAFAGFGDFVGQRAVYAVGADAGGGPRVRLYDATTQQVIFDQFVYEERFLGGVRVATGDVTGDGVADLVTAAGYGGGPRIRVFDGATSAVVADFFAYQADFRGGAFVAVGDLTGDGVGEIITGAGLGGGPQVRVFDGTGAPVSAFFAYDDRFRGGVRVAAGDINGDGFTDIVTGPGAGGGPHVRAFNAADLSVVTEFMAYDESYRGGVYVAAGDIDGDGFADIVVGPGDNTLSEIRFRSTRDLGALVRVNVAAAGDTEPQAPLTAGVDVLNLELGGIRVGVTNDSTGLNPRILASRGPGYAPRVRRYSIDPPAAAGDVLAFEREFSGGLFVG